MTIFDFDALNLPTAFLFVFALQLCFFAFAAFFKTDRLTDLSYGLTFAALAVLMIASTRNMHQRALIALVMVIIWALRLAAYLFVRILRIGRDARFDGIREHPLRFGAFWLLQAFAVWLIMTPLIISAGASGQPPLGVIDVFGWICFVLGFALESIADFQKYEFKNKRENRGNWIASGLWKYARHPNYFGEILLWWGLFIASAMALEGFGWLTVLGPLFLTFLLLRVSGVPTLEKQAREKYSGNLQYEAYRRRTRLLLPLPRFRTRVQSD